MINPTIAGTMTALLLMFKGLPALGEIARSDLAREDWTRLNQYSPLESYQSKGSYGWHIGVGMMMTLDEEQEYEQYKAEREPDAPRLLINTGTRWPLDLGLSASHYSESEAWQYGGHIQWTLFEGFRLPSVALRYSRMVLSNMKELGDLNTDSLQLGFSYGFLRYMCITAAIGQQWEEGRTRIYQETGFSLTQEELTEWKVKRVIYSWGLSINPFTPFVQLAVEQVFWEGEPKIAMGKLSFLL